MIRIQYLYSLYGYKLLFIGIVNVITLYTNLEQNNYIYIDLRNQIYSDQGSKIKNIYVLNTYKL